MISVIIRTKNEERWIRPCLEGVLKQKLELPVEIVLVDNASTDKTVKRALAICPELKLVELSEFRPGHAINEGIRASSGKYIVCLSAHCPPVDEHWMDALLRNLSDKTVAGVYGRQVPTRFTSAVDKRDLLLTFGLDRRVQVKDSFFHNANSMFRREIWDMFPFDEQISNIEDRLWGDAVIEAGYTIVYEPEAAVFHHHGIHQDNNPGRAHNVVRILESHLPDYHPDMHGSPFDPEALEMCAIIPLRGGGDNVDFDERLVARTLEIAKASKYLDRIFVSTDDEKLRSIACRMGAEVPFLRPVELSANEVRVDQVLKQYVEALESEEYYPDIIVSLSVTYPLRPNGLIDSMVEKLVGGGFDAVFAGIPELRPCWKKTETGFVCVTDLDVGRDKREPLHVGVPGLGSAAYVSYVREGRKNGSSIGICEVDDVLSGVEVRTQRELETLSSKLYAW